MLPRVFPTFERMQAKRSNILISVFAGYFIFKVRMETPSCMVAVTFRTIPPLEQ